MLTGARFWRAYEGAIQMLRSQHPPMGSPRKRGALLREEMAKMSDEELFEAMQMYPEIWVEFREVLRQDRSERDYSKRSPPETED